MRHVALYKEQEWCQFLVVITKINEWRESFKAFAERKPVDMFLIGCNPVVNGGTKYCLKRVTNDVNQFVLLTTTTCDLSPF